MVSIEGWALGQVCPWGVLGVDLQPGAPQGRCWCIPESAGNSVWGGSGEAVKAGTGRGCGHWGVCTTGLLNN